MRLLGYVVTMKNSLSHLPPRHFDHHSLPSDNKNVVLNSTAAEEESFSIGLGKGAG